MVVIGPVLLCWFFLLATAIPASILIAIGEILMAGFYYYLLAGVALAIWIYRDLHGYWPELFQVARAAAVRGTSGRFVGRERYLLAF